jgi:twitching motility protein PilT
MEVAPQHEPEINKLFRLARKYQARDLYLQVGLPPLLRVKGDIRQTLLQPLSPQDLEHLLLPILSAEQQQCLDQGGVVAFTYVFEKDNRVRLSVFKMQGRFKLAARWDETGEI